MAQKVIRRSLTTEAWVRFRCGPCEHVVHRMALGLFLLRVFPFSPVIIIPPVLHTHLNVPVAGRTSGRTLEPSNGSTVLKIVEHCIEKYFQFCFASSKSGIEHLTFAADDMTLCWYSVWGVSGTRRRFVGWCCFSSFWPSFCFKINGASWNLLNASLL